MKNMFAPPERSPGRAAEIKAWVHQHLELGENDLVSVAELTCHEPGCPPVETVVTVHRSDQKRSTWKIHKPMSGIRKADVENALADTIT